MKNDDGDNKLSIMNYNKRNFEEIKNDDGDNDLSSAKLVKNFLEITKKILEMIEDRRNLQNLEEIEKEYNYGVSEVSLKKRRIR